MGLFPNPDPLVLSLPDADLLYFEKVDFAEPALLEQLIKETQWKSEEISVFGKTYLQPRLVAWYGDEGASYT